MAGFLLGITLGQIYWRRLSGDNVGAGQGDIIAHHFTVTSDAMSAVDFTMGTFTDARDAVIGGTPPSWLAATPMATLPGTTSKELAYALKKAREEWS